MSTPRSGPPDDSWDEQQQAIGGHFLQSRPWSMVQSAQGLRTLHARGEGWSWSAAVRTGHGVRYLYVPYGPTLTDTVALAPALASLRAAAPDVTFIRVEPRGTVTAEGLRALGAVPVAPQQPQHTWVLPLDVEEAALLSGMSTNRRRNIRAAEKKGISIRISREAADVDTFLRMMGATTDRGHFNAHPDAYYRQLMETLAPIGAARLYLAEAEGATVAGAITFCGRDAWYYAHVAADQELSRRLSAPGPLAWRMLQDARAAGAKRYDFYGVAPDDDPEHPWAGLSRFKREFGGHLESTVGTWELPVRALRYRALSAARRALPR